jgi:hypothetical protein
VQYSRPDYAANASKGILLLHHHNTTAMRAQVVAVSLQSRRPSLSLK